MGTTPGAESLPSRRLSLFDSICMIIGIIIGAGIYETTPLVAQNVTSPLWMATAWLTGGLMALVGALVFAELSTRYPVDGGNYVYITQVFGRRTGFLYSWIEFWIVRPGSIGAMAYVFGRYASKLAPLELGQRGPMVYAVGSIVILTAIHTMGVSLGKWTQNLLTVAKTVGLLPIVVVGLLLIVPSSPTSPMDAPPESPSFSFALIFVMFTLGGWNEISFVAAEVQNPSKNLLRALVLGTVGVTVIYLLVTMAMVRALGLIGVAESEAVAADVMKLMFGVSGERAISLLICVSCLGAVNGMIFTGARIFYAMGTEHRSYGWLGVWNRRRGTPAHSLTLQAMATLALVVGFGWHESGFSQLVIFTSPFYWLFLFLVSLCVFAMRRTDAGTGVAYRVPLYPMVPMLFCLSSFLMFLASFRYSIQNLSAVAWWAYGMLAVGIVLCFYVRTEEEG